MGGRYEEMGAALSAVSTASTTLWKIYQEVIKAEIAYTDGWENRDKSRFNQQARELLFNYDDYRGWGETPHSWVRDYSTGLEGIEVRLRTDMYRQEDWSNETIVFPQYLVDAYETPDFAEAMTRFINSRVAEVQAAYEEEKRSYEERAAIQKREQEERDRAEYARLQAKFGGAA